MGGTAGASYDYNFNLNLLPGTTAPLTVKARTLEITGGQFDANYTNVDSLTLNQLDTALTLVDFSEYNGNFVTQGWDSTQGSNAEVVVNEFGFIFDVGGNNTVFAVPAGTAVPTAEQQTIDFVGAGPMTGAGNITVGGIVIPFAGGELDAAIAAAVAAAINTQDIYGTGNVVAAAAVGTVVTITAAIADGDVPAVTVVDTDTILTTPGAVAITDDFVAATGANINEVITLDFTAGGGFGDLADGESISITFAGGQYVFTNDTGAAILQADIDNAIIADAANSSSAFTIATGGGNLVQLTATLDGNMPATVVAATDVANTPGNVTVATTVAGDLVATNVTGFDLVTAVSEFLTKFTFTEDAYDFGVVWQIDNFQAIDAGDNVTISNQTQLDLRALGVNSSTKITISAGDAYLAAVNADLAKVADYTAFGNYTLTGADNIVQIQELTANDTVITSNDGKDFTIILAGVQAGDLQNENIIGIA
jgi:hypothetical protein